jgi:hypothetical protein
MIVQQHDKTGVSESRSKLREAVLLYGRVAVRHRDGRVTRRFALWKIKPSAKFHVTISRECDFAAGHYYEYLFTGLRIAAPRHRKWLFGRADKGRFVVRVSRHVRGVDIFAFMMLSPHWHCPKASPD